jgi:hypothetical protein
MKTARVIFALLVTAVLASAEDKGGFKTSDFFKAYAGEWEMTGELQKGDGGVIKIKESWKAEFQGDDTLNIEGKRELDGNSQDFVWTLTHNPTTGLYEASHRIKDSGDAIRFEVSVSGTEMKIDMTALLGNNSKIAITDAFADKEHDTIESKITMTDDTGATTLSGTLTHKRVKKP